MIKINKVNSIPATPEADNVYLVKEGTDNVKVAVADNSGNVKELVVDSSNVVGLSTELAGKQDVLVSGTNIKSINGTSILGSGDVVINTGGVSLSGITAYHLLEGSLSLSNTSITTGFSTTLYTGNGTTQSINTGVDMATQWGNDASETFGGLVWLKSRSSASWAHFLQDTVRGIANFIQTNSTSAQATTTPNIVSAVSSTGFNILSNSNSNNNADTYASWNFQTTHRISSTDGATEMISNGDFSNSTTGWINNGLLTMAVSSGVLNTTDNNTTNGWAYQDIPTTVGKLYTVKADLVSVTGGTATLAVGNTSDSLDSSVVMAVGTNLLTFTATNTTTRIRLISNTATTAMSVDNVSVKECLKPTNHSKYYECHYNPYTGFTIVKYEGSGIAGHEIPHHLGRKLDLTITKNLSTTINWACTSDKFNIGFLPLNLTSANDVANYTDSTDDFFKANGTNAEWNTSTNQYIMYGWANSYFDEANTLIGNYEIGVYQGTGAAGNKVKTRGKPAWVMTKCISSTGSWYINDNKRVNISGVNDGVLYPNLSNAEVVADLIDINSDGFTISTTSADMNASGGQYLYMVVYDNDSGSGKSKYPKALDNAVLNLTAKVPFANGVDASGTKVSILSKNETVSGVTLSEGKNYVYSKNDGTFGVKAHRPRYLASDLVRTYAGESPDYFDVKSNKWFNTNSGSELVTNGTFNSNTSGWTVVSGIVWDNGTAKATSAGQKAYQQITGLDVTKTYKVSALLSTTGNNYCILDIGTTNGNNDIARLAILGTTTSGYYNATFSGYSSVWLEMESSTIASGACYWDNISVFEADIAPTTEITESRNYLNAVVYADQNGQPTYVEQLPKTQYVDEIKANEFKGKNACTAWVNFDGTTTPPTIRDSYNVSSVVRTATGVFDIYFTTPMDNVNYCIGGISGGPTTGGDHPQEIDGTRTNYKVTIANPATTTNRNNLAMQIQVFGGKN